MKNDANKGWLKELGSNGRKPLQRKPYNGEALVTPSKPNPMGISKNPKRYEGVKPDLTTNFSVEQKQALADHKGK